MSDISVDVHSIPWSYRGSYVSFCSASGPRKDVYLSTHQIPVGRALFALRPSPVTLPPPQGFPDSPSPTSFSASPHTLTWSLEGKPVVEACFQDAKTIRFKGTIPLNLDTDASLLGGGYSSYISPVLARDLPQMLEFTTFGYQGMYLVALKGKLTCINDLTANDGNRRITISGDAWELAIVERDTDPGHEFTPISAIVPPLSKRFEAVQQSACDTFNQYCKALCPWTSSPTSTETYACYAMWASTVRPMGLLKREGVLMSKMWMDKVWSWDNCFNAIALAPWSLDHALNNLLIPFDHQTPQGRLPDSMTQCEALYDFAKPPICGWALFKIQEVQEISAKALEDLYQKLSSQTHFWLINRSNTHSSLPHYVHGNDSGWDNATCFDADPVIVSPDLAAFLVIQTDWLAVTAGKLKRAEESSRWVTTRDRITHDMVEELWKDGEFCIKAARTGKLVSSTSLLPLVALVAASYLPQPIVSAMIARLDHHLTDYGLATEATDSNLYEADGYWRGPIWAPPTMLIESGLRKAGHADVADKIRDRYMSLCDQAGFSENYDALEGKGNRDPMYTWAASVYLEFARERRSRISRQA